MTINRVTQITRILSDPLRKILVDEQLDFDKLQEIRLRAGQSFRIQYDGREMVLPRRCEEKHIVVKEELTETLEYVSDYSLYAYEHEIKQGFITVEGGHRVGMTGKVVMEEGKIKNMKYISSVNIRMSHEVIGCAKHLLPHITVGKQICHTLIISPPRCGKTTLLRDLVRMISDGNEYVKGSTVGVVDERSEIGACYMGTAQNHVGARTDILDCCPKAEGMLMLIRSMAPQVLAVDEIGAPEELRALEYAMHCGCKLLATVHGNSIEELRTKPLFGQLIKEKRFERYVVLRGDERPGEVVGIYDERGILLC